MSIDTTSVPAPDSLEAKALAELEKEGWEKAQQEITMFLKAESGYWGPEE
jgi:hypothetical protein